ncbi:MAG: PilZ domain-containing protein [Acidobacteriia bacterium]|nr:PilZ domain-containing protein [Terriglobia bacterium]
MTDGVPTALEWLLAMGEGDFFQGAPARAQRFDLQLPLRYRAVGEAAWHEGRTDNISQTGVFFSAEWLMAVDTQIEISFVTLVGLSGETVAEIICQGEVVRMVVPATMDTQPGLAARILDYRFVQSQLAPVV